VQSARTVLAGISKPRCKIAPIGASAAGSGVAVIGSAFA
jgi:hypothetical protein